MISHIPFHSLPVTDLDRAIGFWRDVMGLTLTVDAEFVPGARWVMLRPGDARTQIHLDLVDEMPVREKPALPLIAEDVAGIVTHLRSHDTEITQEPAPAPWDETTEFAMFRDSEGNLILLSSK